MAYVEIRSDDLRRRGEVALADLIDAFYVQRDYRAAWQLEPSLTAARHLLARMAAGHEDGLCPTRYELPRLRDRLAGTDPFAGPGGQRLDVDLSVSLLRYTLHLALGHPAAEDRASSARKLDMLHAFEAMRWPMTMTAALRSLEPPHPQYRQLRRSLAELRTIVRRGGWPPVDPKLFLRPGDTAAPGALQVLAERLRASGDLPGSWPWEAGSDVYEGAIAEAVRNFQRRHGLAIDAIVGPRTVAALNVSAPERLEQVAINMDRWRRVPDDLGAIHVRVNIPEFRLRVFEGGESRLRMRTIVGARHSQTPVFSSQIRYLVFNPYWNVPASIVRGEIAPKAAGDPSQLAREGYEVLSGWSEDAEPIDPFAVDWEAERIGYRVRQLPGPTNALGLVKFMFPNRYNVYLHDTPARWLFGRQRRALNHGCVRVANPEELARVLLSETGEWPEERVERAMTRRERRAVPLTTPVPVHLLYLTSWVGADGTRHFAEDVYGRDRAARGWLGCEGEPARPDAVRGGLRRKGA